MNNHHDDFDPALTKLFFERYYVDRGMLKWQGYFLSDHTSALAQEAREKGQVFLPKPQQTPAEIATLLERALANHDTVQIQLKTHDREGRLGPDISGKLIGYYVTTLYLAGHVTVDAHDIRHVTVLK